MGSFTVADKLEFMLTRTGVAQYSVTTGLGKALKSTKEGGIKASKPPPNSGGMTMTHTNPFLARTTEVTVDPVDALFDTVSDIFSSRVAFENEMKRNFMESDFSWPQRMLDKSRAFVAEPPSDIPGVVKRFKNVVREYNEVLEQRGKGKSEKVS